MPLTNTPETLNILNPDFRMPEHCGGDRWSILHGDSLQILRQFEPNSFDAIISATAEIQIQVIDGEIGREFSEEIGLNLFKF